MKIKKFTAVMLSVILLLSLLPANTVFAAEKNPDTRRVYLHAQGDNPSNTEASSTVYMGETANVYLAVDNPNKGDYANGEHTEPQYDLNGYTAKIYFDPEFFDFAGDTQKPIDYTIPDKNIPDGGTKDETMGGDEVETPTEVGYYPYRSGTALENVNGKTYRAAYVTVFFSGTYLPQKPEGTEWYNLCALPLKPKKTGSSAVFVETDSDDPFSLELFAKDVDDRYSPTFKFTTENGGYHTIVIKEKAKPAPPTASPISGSYAEKLTVTLTAGDGCDIYYSLDGGEFQKYTAGIAVDKSAKLECYAVRTSDNKQSNTVTYTYKIIPDHPYLFADNKEPISNVYRKDAPFTVLIADKSEYGSIDEKNEIYYTFSGVSADNIYPGDDPETGWVKLDKAHPAIEIAKTCTVRLITDQMGEYSDAAWYYLGVRPAKVTADKASDYYDKKIDVNLSCSTPNAEIYYTTDGSDPRGEKGVLYSGNPLTFYRDTTVRAVAKYEGEFGDVTSFWYVFAPNDMGVDAFYPPGVYGGEVKVTLTTQNPDNKVEYSVDGGKTWKDYTETLTFDKDTELRARAVDSNGKTGEEYTFKYTLRPQPPVFKPESTQFTDASDVTIYAPDVTNENSDRYELFYTTDGSDPMTSKTAFKSGSGTAVVKISRYTVVKAVVLRDKTTYSSVVTNSYDIASARPAVPAAVLEPGYYPMENGSAEEYSTQFMPVPAGTTIYYTLSDGDSVVSDPVPGKEGTYEYDGTPIKLKGRTVIKAVAVNVFGVKSDIGVFEYIIVPETPKAAPGATINGDRLPVVPVESIPDSNVSYSIGDVMNKLTVPKSGKFYIDTQTGAAYEDKECTKPLGSAPPEGTKINAPAELEIWTELSGVKSPSNTYRYDLQPGAVAPPYADKATGTYDEINFDGENNLLQVSLDSLNGGDVTIQYRFGNEKDWNDYNGSPLKLKNDALLQVRARSGEKYSAVESYVYEFVPLPPIITLPSGRYAANPKPTTTIELDERAPSNRDYTIWYRANGDKQDVRYQLGTEREIDHTMSFKAYITEDGTEKRSANAINYYIIENASAGGSVYPASPYEVTPGERKRISAAKLSESPYNEGIRLLTGNRDADINYKYEYTSQDGTKHTTNPMTYDDAIPIPANSSMKDLTITAWLTENGNEITDSVSVFEYEFVALKTPITSLTASGVTEYASGTKYTLINDYEGDNTVYIYYTSDGSDPTDAGNPNRKLYEGEELTITGNVTVKAAYFSACGECVNCMKGDLLKCTNSVLGPVGSYRYTVPTVNNGGGGSGGSGGGGGGGGGGLPSKTPTPTPSPTPTPTPIPTPSGERKYTKDIFGVEHPTHIGYIAGYPDGSVKPDENITREEIASVLYRIKNKEYDAPFIGAGDVFPDVTADRWSAGEIEYMAKDGVLSGYPDGEFKPAQNLTRAEFAALIARFAGLDGTGAENPFPDLPDEHWARNDAAALCASGLLSGYEDGSFRPGNFITRAEVMTVINKLLGRNPSDGYVRDLSYNPYNDLSPEQWHYVIVLEATITHDYHLDNDGVEISWENIK